MSADLEREIKLSADAGFTLPDLSGVVDGATVVALAERDLDATYYDTPDLRLTRWGVSVRFRTGDDTGWTVKLPSTGTGEMLARRELNFGGRPGEVPAQVTHLVRAFARHDELAPVGRLRTSRRGVVVLDGSGRRLAEVVDDEVSVFAGDHVASGFRELEVELSPAANPAVARAIVRRLRKAGAGRPDPTSKIVRALGPRAQQPPEVPPGEVKPSSTVRELVAGAVSAAVRRLLAHDPGVRLGGDDEDVHQARVATRRLRSDLRSFRSFLSTDEVASLRDELKWLGGELGAVRDADVLLDRLQREVAALDPRDRPDGAALLPSLGEARIAARRDLLDAFDSDRYVDLVERLVAIARQPPVSDNAEQPASAVAAEVVRRPWGHLRKAVDSLGPNPPDAALHDARKRAKQARYAAEAVVPVTGKKARAFAKAMASVQEVLGAHQDAVVAEERLREAAAAATDARQAFVAGLLVARQRTIADTARDEWRDVWSAASKKEIRSWLTP